MVTQILVCSYRYMLSLFDIDIAAVKCGKLAFEERTSEEYVTNTKIN